MSYLERGWLDFEENELGFWNFGFSKRKISNLGPIFARVVHVPIFDNFCNYGFVATTKKLHFPFYHYAGGSERAIFVRWLPRAGCRGGTTKSFKGIWPWSIVIPEVTSIFSVCLHILHFFWTFRCLNSNLNCGTSNTLQSFLWGGYEGKGAERHHCNFQTYKTLKGWPYPWFHEFSPWSIANFFYICIKFAAWPPSVHKVENFQRTIEYIFPHFMTNF
jgi:hypothetical protein